MRVFFSYSHKDEALRSELETHLAVLHEKGLITTWYARKAAPGEVTDVAVTRELEAADVVLLLVSADFFASEYRRGAEVRRALERHKEGSARVVPVVLRPCLWREAAFGELSPLPRDGRPVTRWEDRDEAWLDVATGLRELAVQPGAAPAPAPRGQEKGSAPADKAPSSEERPAAPADKAPSSEARPAAPAAARPEVEQWLRELEAAQVEKQGAILAGTATAAIQARIDELKGRLRQGGQLQQNDSLGDGRYFLLRSLGRGGFATVWEADDRKTGERVAIKVLHPHLAGDSERRERFFRGARAMARLDHPHVARVRVPYEVDAGFYYFVMELLDVDLHRAVLDGRIERARVVPLILEVGGALALAHEKGFVHRDVSPHNILLDAAGAAKLSDFDLVAGVDTTGGTRTGAMGKLLYAAPEAMLRPQDADARADVFGLGMTAIFCLYGAELPASVLRRPDQLLVKLDVGVMARFLAKAIESEREDRYATVQAFCDALRSTILAPAPAPPPPIAVSPGITGTSSTYGSQVLLDMANDMANGASAAAPDASPPSSTDSQPNPLRAPPRSQEDEPPSTAARPPRRTAMWVIGAVLALTGSGAAAAKLLIRDLVPEMPDPPPETTETAVPMASGVSTAAATATPTATAATQSSCPPDMVPIAAGTFRMGSEVGDKDADPDERPAHDVTLSAYCIDATEVTVEAYRQCTKEKKNDVTCPPAETTVKWDGANVKLGSQFCNGDRADRDKHPINCVDWNAASAYCQWAGKALPTEAQWEYAARGKEGRKYPWKGDAPPGPELLNACGAECRAMGKRLGETWQVMYEQADKDEATAPVKNYPRGATPEKVYDMAGNVWEWVQDRKTAYKPEALTDPLQKEGTLRVLRGGGWFYYEPRRARTAARAEGGDGFRDVDVGFRCARAQAP